MPAPLKAVATICATPSGPATSLSVSRPRRAVEVPTARTASVMASASAMVRGMRSPPSSTRTITNCPARRGAAIARAATRNDLTRDANSHFSMIRCISGAIRIRDDFAWFIAEVIRPPPPPRGQLIRIKRVSMPSWRGTLVLLTWGA